MLPAEPFVRAQNRGSKSLQQLNGHTGTEMSLVSILQHTGHEFQQNGCEVLQYMLFCPREQQGITATETPVQFYCIQQSIMMLNKHWLNKTN